VTQVSPFLKRMFSVFIFLYFQLDTLFFRLRTISANLFLLHVSGLTGLKHVEERG